MRRLLILAMFLLPTLAWAAPDLRPAIRRDAQRCAAAWQGEDLATVVSFVPPSVVRQRGGRAALMQELRERWAEAREWGAQSLQATPGDPSLPKPLGRWLVSLVPVTAVVHSAHVDLTQQTHALAVPSDKGKRWFFVLLYGISQAELNGWFPEFRGQVKVPVAPRPELSLAY